MPVDYDKISVENKIKYGTEVGVYGPTLLANQYADRTHFILELVQNTEDALRRGERNDICSLSFLVNEDSLTVRHFGRPFNEEDVVAICGIAQSTKEFTDIGHFGIGFKSVYAYTNYPEVHSDEEHFSIKNYVHPTAVSAKAAEPGETVIYLPFKDDIPSAAEEIGTALRELDPLTLLFLRHINEIGWDAPDGSSGWIRRSDSALNGLDIRTIRKGDGNSSEVVAQFVVSGRDVFHEDRPAGRVEIAFPRGRDPERDGDATLYRTRVSKLASFFPTEIDTHLGFLVQGPYRTTPARDNVPFGDEWNQYLVRATADLALEALEQLRDAGLLDLDALECFLPTSETEKDGRFAPIHQAIREALISRALVPMDTGHVSGRDAVVGNPPAVKELLGTKRVRQLVGGGRTTNWLVDEITSGHRKDLLEYLKDEASVREITPGHLIRSLTQGFLEQQPDSWIQRLYGFLSERSGLMLLAKQSPIIRLENGHHVRPVDNDGKPLAYLPGKLPSAYPMVKPSIAKSRHVREFLETMGLREPGIVDDVVDNIFPKYRRPTARLTVKEYEQDIRRVGRAFETADREPRVRLLRKAQGLKLVYAVDCGTGARSFVQANSAYIPTDSLKMLFERVTGVLIVDDSKRFLRDAAVTQLLRAIGASDIFVREPCETDLPESEKRSLRKSNNPWDSQHTAGRKEFVYDFTLRGIDGVLDRISAASSAEAVGLAGLLWDELRRFAAQNKSTPAYQGVYKWYRYTTREQPFPAAFIKVLNQTAWVPDANGELCRPEDVPFSVTGWRDDERLTEEIEFAPEPNPTPDLQAEYSERSSLLRQELIDSGVSEQEIEQTVKQSELGALQNLLDSRSSPSGHSIVERDASNGRADVGSRPEHQSRGEDAGPTRPVTVEVPPRPRPESPGGNSATRPDAGPTSRSDTPPVRVTPDDTDDNPDGLSHEQRLALEQAAIAKILQEEPSLERTPENNPGYDLYTLGADGTHIKVVEVKSMSGSLRDRAATMSRVQFHTAQELQDKYWLYVVEHAGDPNRSRIMKIQNPAGRVQIFTFNRSWFSDDSASS